MLKALKVLLPVFAILFLFFLVLSILSIFRNQISADGGVGGGKKFHYAIFLPNSDHHFFTELKEGAESGAENLDCAVSFHDMSVDPDSLRMAEYAGYDGIAVYLYEQNSTHREALENLHARGIPVVYIENAPAERPDAFLIGTNSFDSGKGIGRVAANSDSSQLDLTLVYSERNPGLLTDSNLLEMGIKEILGDRLHSLQSTETGLNPLDAEALAYEIMQGGIEPEQADSGRRNIVVLTDLDDTLVTLQAITDMNLVGQVGVIGFGDNESIQEYIGKDLLMGSIVRNPYRIGYSSIMALEEISEIGYTSAYVDTGISILFNEEDSSDSYIGRGTGGAD